MAEVANGFLMFVAAFCSGYFARRLYGMAWRFLDNAHAERERRAKLDQFKRRGDSNMTDKFVSAEVPFTHIGNRRCITRLDIEMNPYLADFIRRFPSSFEWHPYLDAVMFVEPD